nr:gliding motility-associated C-terminal domain-containing protein [Pedobacter sp. ASV2]
MKNKIYLAVFVVFISSAFISGDVYSQDFQLPHTLNSAGNYGTVNGYMTDYSLGEMVLVETYKVNQYLLSQGFLQPFYLNLFYVTNVEARNNVLTPNGDGRNDFFIVKGLGNHPGSVLSIYDRAGRLIYRATDYKNDWNGTLNGMQLFEDTYYYIIDLGKGKALVKGFISIIRDEND